MIASASSGLPARHRNSARRVEASKFELSHDEADALAREMTYDSLAASFVFRRCLDEG